MEKQNKKGKKTRKEGWTEHEGEGEGEGGRERETEREGREERGSKPASFQPSRHSHPNKDIYVYLSSAKNRMFAYKVY